MKKSAYALMLVLALAFGPARAAVAQQAIPAAPAPAPPAAVVPAPLVPVPVAPLLAPPLPLGPVSSTATGDVHSSEYGVVASPNGGLMIAGGSDEMVARTELTGLWRVVDLEQNGTSNPALAEQLQMRFYPGKVELMQTMHPTIEMAYRPETLHDPHHFSWSMQPCGLIVLQRGVYWLTDDGKLLLCLGSINRRRATDFVTEPGDGRTLFILERVKQAK